MSEDTGFHYSLGLGRNERTTCVYLNPEFLQDRMSPQELFLRKHDWIRDAYAETTEDSYLLVAVHLRDRTAARARVVKLEPGAFTDLIVGRHTRCHLTLEQDPGVSLRHLLVRLYLRPLDLVPVFRVLDLCTDAGFMTADGRGTRGLVGAGHGMFRVGEYLVFLISNQDEAWPDDPEKAWERLQAREFPTTECEAFRSSDDLVSAGQLRPRLRISKSERVERLSGSSRDPNHSCFARILGPEYVEDHTPGPEGTRAYLKLREPWGGLDLRVDLLASQLRRGVLIGRYDRCELGGKRVGFPQEISRVHLILLEDEGRVYAIDAASSNGCAVSGVSFTTRELTGPAKIDLSTVIVEWEPVEPKSGEGTPAPPFSP
jgi:hypothetical protein